LNQFFRTPTKVVFLAIFIGLILVVASSSTVIAEDREPLMDLENGGAVFFYDIVPSIIQVYAEGGAGSGYVFDREGHAITNNHVTQGALGVLEVGFYNAAESLRTAKDARFRADVLCEDSALDLAVIKIDAPPEVFHPIRLGDSAAVNPGDTVATFGSPGGDAAGAGLQGLVDRSATNFMDSWLEFYNLNLGVISEVLNFEESFIFYMRSGEDFSRLTRDYGSAVEYLFHTDSAINHGNSGGPCVNVYGEALGTNTWGYGGENMGFSVPVNLLKRSVTDVLEYGRVRRPWCGIALHEKHNWNHEYYLAWTTSANVDDLDISIDSTPDQLKIYTVNPYSPAYEAGLREGDIITKIDGRVFENIFDIYSYILAKEVDDVVTIEYERDGHGMPLASVSLAEKETRFYGTSTELFINSQEGAMMYGRPTANIPRYVSDLTY
jgi:S1-C subfamily serine protease